VLSQCFTRLYIVSTVQCLEHNFYYTTNTRPVYVLSYIKSAVTVSDLCFYLCVREQNPTDISAQVPLIDMKVCTTVDLSAGQIFSLFADDNFRGHQMRGQERDSGGCIFGLSGTDFCHLTANISKTVSPQSTRVPFLTTHLMTPKISPTKEKKTHLTMK